MSESLQLQVRPQYTTLPAVQAATLNVLVEVTPTATTGARLPLDICVLLDVSGTMRRFELPPEAIPQWEEVARSRGELVVKRIDHQEGVIFTGETLRELQATAKKPLDLAVLAIKRISGRLAQGDRLSLVAFASRAVLAYDGARDFDKGRLFEALNRLQAEPGALRIGDGTRAAEGVRMAAELLSRNASSGRVGRLIVLTDGIVQDRGATLGNLEAIRRQNLSTTTVGIGQDFDEEFLAKAADSSGGEYYYAAEPGAVADHLAEEMAQMQAVVARQLQVQARGINGVRVVDMHQVRPRLRIFEEIDTSNGMTTVSLGDVQAGKRSAVMLELAVPPSPAGDGTPAEVSISWLEPGGSEPQTCSAALSLSFADKASEPDPEVTDLASRLAVYKAEREAQWAQEDGDINLATRKLRAATRILGELGERELAAQFDQQAAALEANQALDPRRTKSLKHATRRLTTA